MISSGCLENRRGCHRVLLLLGALISLAGVPAADLQLVIDAELGTPAQHAQVAFQRALAQHEYQVVLAAPEEHLAPNRVTIGVAGRSAAVDAWLARGQRAVPESPESLLIARDAVGDGVSLLIAGRDDRGLAYALYEAADALRNAPLGPESLAAIQAAEESPFLAVRSVTTQLFNEDVERDWYGSEDYWHWFFREMARNRLNNYALTFGHNTNYLVPPYAWFFEVPEYPDVRVEGMSDEARAANLKHLQRISEIAGEYGVDFTVGLWTQLPVVKVRVGLDYGPSPVVGLPEGEAGGDYCAKGLQQLLEACPEIDGVQLRMNLESGIPHEAQERYYQSLFDAIANCGRPVGLDMRYKSLSQRTIDLANEAGLNVNVSTKFWCEHLGLPFHPTWQDPAYSESRYGYGKMLHYPRNYRVTFRLWNVGSSRLLLWGDPDYGARFARSCALSGGAGFEVFAPLSNMGYGNEPGDWRLFAKPEDEHYTWENERYWAQFLTFGRYGYNPDTPDTVWARAFGERFGTAGSALDTAYRAASQVMPLATATTQMSAANWRLWPEMETCMHLDAYRAIQPGDYSQFYAIAPFSSRQQWRAEGWAATHSAFVEDALANNLNSKWTPIEVANKLDALATETLAALEEAQHRAGGLGESERKEFDATTIDLAVVARLAQYHAEKKRAAVHLEFFRLTNEKARLPLVWKHINASKVAWEAIVALTDGFYYDDMVFGFSKEHNSDFPDRLQEHIGHWKDRLDDVQQDVDFVATFLKNNGIALDIDTDAAAQLVTRYPGETPVAVKPTVSHQRIVKATPGVDITITARVESAEPLRQVSVYYRPVDQTRAWKRLTMDSGEKGVYSATIPGGEIDPAYDFQYYLEARVAHGGTFWPHWEQETPYVVVAVTR